MTFEACSDAVITRLQTLTAYFESSDHVAFGNFGVLDKGINIGAAVLFPGKFESDEPGSYDSLRVWEILLELFQRYRDDEAANWDAFMKMRDAVIIELGNHPTLDGVSGVINVIVSAPGKPQTLARDGNPNTVPIFIIQTLHVEVFQKVALTGGEYAT